ncbi:hypothetical protein KKC16_01270, partial [Patescibacteria group bacterium]|nr:hypothetical protein [Patescibacteria group bacterium]
MTHIKKYKSIALIFISFITLFFLLTLINSSFASASSVGMGIKWYTESEIVDENIKHCVVYGLYNPYPFDTDVEGYLEASGQLEVLYIETTSTLVPKFTNSTNAIPIEICFNVPKVYNESCILGFCERICPVKDPETPYKNETRFKGSIIGKYSFFLGEQSAATGSKTGTAVAVPLELIVKCSAKQRNNKAMYTTFILILIV